MILKRVYSMKELVQVVGRSRASIYKDIRDRRFPRPISIGAHSRRWLVHEVDEWLTSRAAERDRVVA